MTDNEYLKLKRLLTNVNKKVDDLTKRVDDQAIALHYVIKTSELLLDMLEAPPAAPKIHLN